MISQMMLAGVLRIAGAVLKQASLSPGSSVAPQWGRYAAHTSVAPMNAPMNSPAKYFGTSLQSVLPMVAKPECDRRVEMRPAELPDREDSRP